MQELDEDFIDTGKELPPLEWPALVDEQENFQKVSVGDLRDDIDEQKVSIADLRDPCAVAEDGIRDLEIALGVEPIEREGEEINSTICHLEERRSEQEQQTFEALFYGFIC
jgi:hypothetical protein